MIQPRTSLILSVVALTMPTATTLFGCASTPGARPEDMSAQSHEVEAERRAQLAEEHEANYDPDARGGTPPGSVHGSEFGFEGTELNPTEIHRLQAQ